MIKPEQVPKGPAKAVHELFEPGYLESIGLHPESIIAAALSAWPGMKLENLCGWVMDGDDLPYVEEAVSIILPLPQEASDE